MEQTKRFYLLLVKPTRYDDDGYPVHWFLSALPSNSLACMHGIAKDCRDRAVLGEDTEIIIEAVDENNQPLKADTYIRRMREEGAQGMLALVGVQSNQYPRAIDIAQPFLQAGIPVCMGGYHVSGSLKMFPEPTPELVDAMQSGIALFAGEAEEQRFDQVLIDARNGSLQKLYDYSNDLPDLSTEPPPYITPQQLRRYFGGTSSIDLGRGCPFTCSFCCIINVQGKKSRFRSVEALEQVVRATHESGSNYVFITDDNFARNQNWEALLDKLIELRAEGLEMQYVIQVDMLCHRIPGFIDKCIAAGVAQVFVGLENINPDNLASVNKRQNRITEYREMLLDWKRHNVIIWGGYIIGFPNDTRESILHDVELIKRELPIDLLNISILTPLPGSEDHKKMHDEGIWMDPDLNNYDLAHRVIHHPRMSDEELDQVYEQAWDNYYTFDHMVTVLRRRFALGPGRRKAIVDRLIGFGVVTRQQGMRSYDMGFIRRKTRKSRRKGLPLENPLLFYPKLILHEIKATAVIAYSYRRLLRMANKIIKDPNRWAYKDTAITVAANEDLDNLALFNETRGGQDVVVKFKQLDKRPGVAPAK
jgi:radical SAM superfamily enzyme YgiQ (UPF0313 family)